MNAMNDPLWILVYCDEYPFQLDKLFIAWESYGYICPKCVCGAKKCSDALHFPDHFKLWHPFDDVNGLTGGEIADRAYAALRTIADLGLVSANCLGYANYKDVPDSSGSTVVNGVTVINCETKRLQTLSMHIHNMMMDGLRHHDTLFTCEYANFVAGKRVQ